MSWQLKGWLLLTSALVASALVASTAGAASKPSPPAAAVGAPCSVATAMRQPEVGKAAAEPWWRYMMIGDMEPACSGCDGVPPVLEAQGPRG